MKAHVLVPWCWEPGTQEGLGGGLELCSLGAGSWAYARAGASGLHLQLQFSDVLTKWRRFFHQMAAEQGKAGLAAMDMKLEVAVLQVGQPCPRGYEWVDTVGAWEGALPGGTSPGSV